MSREPNGDVRVRCNTVISPGLSTSNVSSLHFPKGSDLKLIKHILFSSPLSTAYTGLFIFNNTILLLKKGVREKVFKSIPLTLRVLKSGWRGGLYLKIYDNCVVSEMALNVHHVNSLACPLPVACLRRVIKQKLSFSLPPRHDDDDEYADDGDECFPNKLTKFIGTNSPPFFFVFSCYANYCFSRRHLYYLRDLPSLCLPASVSSVDAYASIYRLLILHTPNVRVRR